MRALCGAIISAGALIGLGLTALGIGTRYDHFPSHDKDGNLMWMPFTKMDTALLIALFAALIALAIGLGIAFLGLAYHHHRRHVEMTHAHQRHAKGGAEERIPV